MNPYDLSHVPDAHLVRNLDAITASVDGPPAAVLLAHIGEVEARNLYQPAGYTSMFAYCVGRLHMSEDIAYKRIRVARKARRFPEIFRAIAEGRLHLAGAYLLARHLTKRNVEGLLAAATHKSKREIELLLADRFPKADVPSFVRALPTIAPVHAIEVAPVAAEMPVSQTVQLAPGPVAPATSTQDESCDQRTPDSGEIRGRITPLGRRRFSLQAMLSESGEADLRALQGLLAHRIPDRNVGEVTEIAYKIARAALEKQKFAATNRPTRTHRAVKQGSRHVPAYVRRAVWERDGGRCTFVGKDGKRCEERGQLEFDHEKEFARGGEATIAGMRLLCRAHNQHAAECTYGAKFMEEKRQAWSGALASSGTVQT